jgi:hypothetical protein
MNPEDEITNVEYFLALREEIKPYLGLIGKASDKIREEKVTKYPIFVISQEEVSIGVKILKKGGRSGKWNVFASTMEEFVSKDLILKDRSTAFIKTYKDPDTFICIFSLSELGARFLFLPRQLEG